MEYLSDYGLFLAQTITLIVAFIIIIAVISSMSERGRHDPGQLEIKILNEKFKNYKKLLNATTLPKHLKKEADKADKVAAKSQKRQAKEKSAPAQKRVFVVDFHGDIRASQTHFLREEVSAILTVATKEDEVVVRLESPGGMVHGYGLAASQLARFREHEIPLTIAIDKVAASGGYMMACVGNRILAAPFAMVGSVGVLAQIPNFHRFLKKHDVDYEQITAGEYKRTLTVFGENTTKARNKFQEEIEDIHQLFKQFVGRYRPQVNIEQIATGEHWPAIRGIDFKLVDEIKTSDDYLMAKSEDHQLYEVTFTVRKTLGERVGAFSQKLIDRLFYQASTPS